MEESLSVTTTEDSIGKVRQDSTTDDITCNHVDPMVTHFHASTGKIPSYCSTQQEFTSCTHKHLLTSLNHIPSVISPPPPPPPSSGRPPLKHQKSVDQETVHLQTHLLKLPNSAISGSTPEVRSNLRCTRTHIHACTRTHTRMHAHTHTHTTHVMLIHIVLADEVQTFL